MMNVTGWFTLAGVGVAVIVMAWEVTAEMKMSHIPIRQVMCILVNFIATLLYSENGMLVDSTRRSTSSSFCCP